MLPQLITKYLETHRRVNLPGVGAFIVKTQGEVIFSELLRSDDGVLRSLLEGEGMNDIESAASLDRFLFELKHTLELPAGSFTIEGLGDLRLSEDGKIIFTQTSSQTSPRAEQPQEVELQVTEPQIEIDEQEIETPASTETSQRIRELYSDQKTFRENDRLVRDLTYVKEHSPRDRGKRAGVRLKRKAGVDKTLVFAILAVLIAVGVIAYGCYVANVEAIGEIISSWGFKSVE